MTEKQKKTNPEQIRESLFFLPLITMILKMMKMILSEL
jgi:hypothetical protein